MENRTNTKETSINNSYAKHLLIGFFLIGLLAIAWYFILPPAITNARLEKAAVYAKYKDLDDGHCFEGRFDWWDQEICISREANEERTAILYTAHSAGRDGEYGTDDDYTQQKVDLNKSKIAGKWAGERAVQAFKGWKEGILKKNKHDK